jgi:hypothetical protein
MAKRADIKQVRCEGSLVSWFFPILQPMLAEMDELDGKLNMTQLSHVGRRDLRKGTFEMLKGHFY